MKVALVGPQSLAHGFGLLGVECLVAETAKAAFDAVQKVSARRDIGVVLISEDLYGPYYERYFQMKINQERPILMEVPAVLPVDLQAEGIAQFVKKSTGVTV